MHYLYPLYTCIVSVLVILLWIFFSYSLFRFGQNGWRMKLKEKGYRVEWNIHSSLSKSSLSYEFFPSGKDFILVIVIDGSLSAR